MIDNESREMVVPVILSPCPRMPFIRCDRIVRTRLSIALHSRWDSRIHPRSTTCRIRQSRLRPVKDSQTIDIRPGPPRRSKSGLNEIGEGIKTKCLKHLNGSDMSATPVCASLRSVWDATILVEASISQRHGVWSTRRLTSE